MVLPFVAMYAAGVFGALYKSARDQRKYNARCEREEREQHERERRAERTAQAERDAAEKREIYEFCADLRYIIESKIAKTHHNAVDELKKFKLCDLVGIEDAHYVLHIYRVLGKFVDLQFGASRDALEEMSSRLKFIVEKICDAEADEERRRKVREAREKAEAAELARQQQERDRVREQRRRQTGTWTNKPKATKIYIKSVAHGTYVYPRGDRHDTVGHRKTPFFWNMISNSDNTVLLQADGCMHLSGAPNRAVIVHTNALNWEKWVVEGSYIRSQEHGTYLSAVADQDMVNLQPHKLQGEQFRVVPVTEAEAIKLMEEAANAREAEVNEARRRMRQMEADEARDRAARAEDARRQAAAEEARRRAAADETRVPPFMTCSSSPGTTYNLVDEDQIESYKGKIGLLRDRFEIVTGKEKGDRIGVCAYLDRMDRQISTRNVAWAKDLYAYTCDVCHADWSKSNYPANFEWFKLAKLRFEAMFAGTTPP